MKEKKKRFEAAVGAMLALAVVVMTTMGDAASADRFAARISDDGNRVVVTDESGRILRSIPKPPGVIRDAFALDKGEVIATSLKDGTTFWNASSGESLRRIGEPVHAVDPGGSLLVTFSSDRDLLLRSYPSFDVVHVLEQAAEWGPSAAVFSSDGRFLAVEFCSHYPVSDEVFLNPVFDATLYNTKIYDVKSGAVLPNMSDRRVGSFSADGRYYVAASGKRFDLERRSWVAAENGGGL